MLCSVVDGDEAVGLLLSTGGSDGSGSAGGFCGASTLVSFFACCDPSRRSRMETLRCGSRLFRFCAMLLLCVGTGMPDAEDLECARSDLVVAGAEDLVAVLPLREDCDAADMASDWPLRACNVNVALKFQETFFNHWRAG